MALAMPGATQNSLFVWNKLLTYICDVSNGYITKCVCQMICYSLNWKLEMGTVGRFLVLSHDLFVLVSPAVGTVQLNVVFCCPYGEQKSLY